MEIPLHTGERSPATLTSTPIEPGEVGSMVAEFGRVADVERIYGLKRGTTYALIRAGKLKSVCLRQPGAKRGIRLVHLPSVHALLHSPMKGGNKMDAPERAKGLHGRLAGWLAVPRKWSAELVPTVGKVIIAGKAALIVARVAAEIWSACEGGHKTSGNDEH